MKDILKGAVSRVSRRIASACGANELLGVRGHMAFHCHRPDGSLVWRRSKRNMVVTVGLNALLDEGLLSNTWYMGLFDDTTYTGPALGDTLASHAGWTEWAKYSGTPNRHAITFGTPAAGALASSSIPTFTVAGATGTETVKGGFICSAVSGTSGTLFAAAAFDEGDAPVVNGYVITGSYSITIANA